MARNYRTQKFWIGGCNSIIHPADLPEKQYAWGENVVNRGGIIQTKPGYKVRASVPGAKLQGFGVFTPRNSVAHLMVAVDGRIYTGIYPGYTFVQVPGLVFDANAEYIEFEPTVRSAKRNQDGSVSLITPTPTVMITDGRGRMGYWDGVTAEHLAPGFPQFGPPSGCLWMAWVGSRLWAAVGNRIVASDIVNPLTFTENIYLAERSNFDLPGDCTGLVPTADQTGLLAFTKSTTTAFKAFIHNRTEWATTPDFQKVIVPGVGCVAGRSAVNQYGETYWLTERGLISLNAALHSLQTSTLDVMDGAMMRSKRCLSPYLGSAASVAHENYLLVSMPYADKYNRHTWVLDQIPLNGLRAPAWNGVWTGVRPVQWVTGDIGGRNRCFFASYDKSSLNETNIHIWEAFLEGREDEGGKTACQIELAPLITDEPITFKYAEIEVVEMLGDVNLLVFVGGTKGAWHQIANIDMQAEKGSLGSSFQQTLNTSSILKAYKPQARTVKTEELVSQGIACAAETGLSAGQDKGFILLLEWRGRMGIREVRMFYDTAAPKETQGACEPSEEGEHNAVTERGETITT
jgi:hypothetical protein